LEAADELLLLEPFFGFQPGSFGGGHRGCGFGVGGEFFQGQPPGSLSTFAREGWLSGNPEEMTEPSIARARQLHPSAQPAAIAKLNALPLPDGARDTLFLLFAAHEIRQPARRAQFFVEAARVLAGSVQLLLVEHLRDF
jgi:hypothetical protein